MITQCKNEGCCAPLSAGGLCRLHRKRWRDRQYYEKNRDKKLNANNTWRKANPEKAKNSRNNWYIANYQRSLINNKKWQTANADKFAEIKKAASTARAKRLKIATPSWANKAQLSEFYKRCPEGMSVDHIVPITHKDVCGLHVPWNLQYLDKPEQFRKRNKFPYIGVPPYPPHMRNKFKQS